MHNLGKAALVVLTVSLLGVLPVCAQTRRALFIAINHYEPPQGKKAAESAGRHVWTNLDGPMNDAKAMRQILISRFQFEEKNIHDLLDRDATREAILRAIRKHVIEEPQPGDIVLFYYAGHGSQVHDSRSVEQDRLDETMVPADSYTGVWDIRDKELARLFNEALDKGVVLTAVFDSCNSGSVTRGYPHKFRERFALPDPRDAAELEAKLPPIKDPPERRGALVFSAAQDTETAKEKEYEGGRSFGAFSRAFEEVLRTGPVTLSAREIFLQVRARLADEGVDQLPVLTGPEARRKQPLFGGNLSGKLTAAVQSVDAGGSVKLLGGYAAGIGANTELKLVSAERSAPPLRLRVVREEDLNFSYAEVIEGKAADVKPGSLFEVDRWVPPMGANLAVWVPRTDLSIAALAQFAAGIAPLRTSDRLQWVEDPTVVSPTHVLLFAAGTWKLSSNGKQKDLGPNPAAQVVLQALASEGKEKPRLFVHLPLAAELAAKLRLGGGTENDAISLLPSQEGAHYVLVGRIAASGGIEYAWVLPGMTEEDKLAGAAEKKSRNDSLEEYREKASPLLVSLPLRSFWFAAGSDAASQAKAVAGLEEKALGIGKLRAWLKLESSPDVREFPYQMAFKRQSDGKIFTSGTVIEGDTFSLILRARPEEVGGLIRQRFLYLFTVDSLGQSVCLFPAECSSVENKFPDTIEVDGESKYPNEFSVGRNDLFHIECASDSPCGVDTYILLTSETAIPDPTVLEWEPVRSGSRKNAATPLGRLLTGVGAATRSAPAATPTNWSIQRVVLRSMPK